MPDFLIVGAMKSGTSALAFHLRNHTDICMPRSELHFFDNDKRLARGLGGYLKQLNRGLRAETQIIGEKCPTYSYLPVAAERIHQSYPDVKLVWIFREPVSRAYSNYLHILKSGGLHCGFEEAVHNEAALIEQNRYLGFMERSRYVEQVLRFLRLFKKEQMHFMVFESFVADLENELARLFDFLGGLPGGVYVYPEDPRPSGLPQVADLGLGRSTVVRHRYSLSRGPIPQPRIQSAWIPATLPGESASIQRAICRRQPSTRRAHRP